MRVFDFMGAREAVDEIRDGLEKKKNIEPASKVEEKNEHALKEDNAMIEPPTDKLQMKRTYVADSEDEEDDEEMLFDSDATITAAAQPVRDPEPAQTEASEAPHPETETEPGQIKIILIDNLAQVLNPLLKKDYIQGIFPCRPSST
jgi:hypothetical protein